jgi:rhamnose utilization protein RhaD (predicted bifunctional aldolase and dehydrogenase)
MTTYHDVSFLGDDAKAASLGRLVHRSNLLGSDQGITSTGGGNTPSKLPERDPLAGRRLNRTTGQVITVDGGLHEAFLR